MKNNLLKITAAEAIIQRVERLKPDSVNLWGEMNATEMLLHCNSCNKQIFEAERDGKKTTVKQLLLRLLALYIAPNFKKDIKSEPSHITKGKISSSEFDKQKAEFIKLIRQFPSNKKPMTLTHPAFGNISTNEWGIAAYKHMDHHLQQSGV